MACIHADAVRVALLPSGLNEVGKFSVICGKVVCYIVLFELLYEGSFLKKLLMAVGHSVIMLGGEFIMYRAFIAAGLNPSEYLRAHGLVQHVVSVFIFHAGCCSGACNAPRSEHVVRKHHGCSETEAFSSADFVCGADDTVPVDRIQNRSSREHGFGIADTVRAAYDTEHRFQFRLLSNISVAQKQMSDNEEEARKAQFELQLGVQKAGHAEDVHRIAQKMRANTADCGS